MSEYKLKFTQKDGSVLELSQLESIYYLSPNKLTKSDKYLIRLIWKRYCNLYKKFQEEQKSGVITQLIKEYPTRRRYYLNLIIEITDNKF
jgi:hypothetical protein